MQLFLFFLHVYVCWEKFARVFLVVICKNRKQQQQQLQQKKHTLNIKDFYEMFNHFLEHIKGSNGSPVFIHQFSCSCWCCCCCRCCCCFTAIFVVMRKRPLQSVCSNCYTMHRQLLQWWFVITVASYRCILRHMAINCH